MSKRRSACGCLFVVMVALWSGRLGAQEFEVGSRPLDGISDPARLLDPELRREFAEEMSLALTKKNNEVLLVVLSDLGDAPPEFLAGRYAANWKTEDVGAVILHVPGRLSSPWVVPFGAGVESLAADQVAMDIRSLKGRTGAEEREWERLRLVIRLTLEILDEWSAELAVQANAGDARPAAGAEDPHDRMMRNLRIYAGVGLAFILGVIATVVRACQRVPQGHVFPDEKPVARLGAPYCGGDHVLVRIDSGKKPVP